jgi:hypothetical protein
MDHRRPVAGDRVSLRFGAFSVRKREARTGRNPRTGNSVSVEAKHVPFFKAGKEMREQLNQSDYAWRQSVPFRETAVIDPCGASSPSSSSIAVVVVFGRQPRERHVSLARYAGTPALTFAAPLFVLSLAPRPDLLIGVAAWIQGGHQAARKIRGAPAARRAEPVARRPPPPRNCRRPATVMPVTAVRDRRRPHPPCLLGDAAAASPPAAITTRSTVPARDAPLMPAWSGEAGSYAGQDRSVFPGNAARSQPA